MLAFIDESGYPRPTDQTQRPVLLAVCVHEDDIRSITDDIFKLKERLYHSQNEIKSTDILRPATIEKNRTINKEYAESMIDILDIYDTAVFAIIMNRPDEVVATPEGYMPKQYYLLLKKIETYCAWKHEGKMLMVFDRVHDGADKAIASSMNAFLYRTTFGRAFHHILELPLFVSSSVTPTIELADIGAGIVRKYYEVELDQHSPEDKYEKWITSLFEKVNRHTVNRFNKATGYMEYGFQTVSDVSYQTDEIASEEVQLTNNNKDV